MPKNLLLTRTFFPIECFQRGICKINAKAVNTYAVQKLSVFSVGRANAMTDNITKSSPNTKYPLTAFFIYNQPSLLAPQFGQNLPGRVNLNPQFEQTCGELCAAPQLSQNAAPGVNSAPQLSQYLTDGLALMPANDSETAPPTMLPKVPPTPVITPRPTPRFVNSPTPSFCAAFSATSNPRSC